MTQHQDARINAHTSPPLALKGTLAHAIILNATETVFYANLIAISS